MNYQQRILSSSSFFSSYVVLLLFILLAFILLVFVKKIDSNELIHVGVNDFTKPDEKIDIPILEIGRDVEEHQNKKIEKHRKSRDAEYVKKTLSKVKDSCKNGDNLLPSIIGAVKAGATMGEIVIIMKNEFGEWNETSVF